jgi:hypothetical protein
MLLALMTLLAQYGGGGGQKGGGGSGYSAGYWVLVAVIGIAVIGGIAWLVSRARRRRVTSPHA